MQTDSSLAPNLCKVPTRTPSRYTILDTETFYSITYRMQECWVTGMATSKNFHRTKLSILLSPSNMTEIIFKHNVFRKNKRINRYKKTQNNEILTFSRQFVTWNSAQLKAFVQQDTVLEIRYLKHHTVSAFNLHLNQNYDRLFNFQLHVKPNKASHENCKPNTVDTVK
jgi:hypothetical protein